MCNPNYYNFTAGRACKACKTDKETETVGFIFYSFYSFKNYLKRYNIINCVSVKVVFKATTHALMPRALLVPVTELL
jgi:hypothetical protein